MKGRDGGVSAAGSVGQRTAHTRRAQQEAAGVCLMDGWGMVDAVAVQAADDKQVVRLRRDVRQKITNFKTRLAAGSKWFEGAEQRVLGDVATCHDRPETVRQRLPGIADQIGFGIKEIHVRGTAMHKQPDHAFGPRGFR